MGRVNKVDLAWAYIDQLKNGDGGKGKAASKEALANLSSYGVRHVRFAIAPYYWGALEDCFFASPAKRAAYLARLDELFADAAELKIKLSPTLWWYIANFSWSAGNSHPQDNIMADMAGKGLDRFREFCQVVVPRFASHPALEQWEVCCEADLYQDWARLPRKSWREWLGRNFFPRAIGIIKRLDSGHPVLTGNSNFGAILGELDIAEDAADKISLHYYRTTHSIVSTLKGFQEMASTIGKPLCVGEIGLPYDTDNLYSTSAGVAATKARIEELAEVGIWDAYWWQYRDGRDSHRLVNAWRLQEGVSDQAINLIVNYRKDMEVFEQKSPSVKAPLARLKRVEEIFTVIQKDLKEAIQELEG